MRRAFTLIELLTVMAISAMLLAIIIIPLMQSFNMTRTAQAFADAQDRARVLTERIAAEIGSAVSVRSQSSSVLSRLNGVDPVKIGAHALVVEVPGADGSIVETILPFTKIDLVKPAEGNPQRGPNGGFIDPVTGLEDPTLTAPKGQVVVPVVPGQTLTRYFVGLRDPFSNYNNPYDGALMARNGQQDNLYVLYKAEVQPIFADGSVNTGFFAVDEFGRPVLDDPRFFLPNRDAGGQIITDDEHAERIKNWLGLGGSNAILAANQTRRAIIQTEVSRYDMVQPVVQGPNSAPLYDGNIPRLVPLVQFRPARVNNEPAEGAIAARMGEETSTSSALAPSVYETNHKLWDRPIVRNWPRFWDPSDADRNGYNVSRGDVTNGDPGAPQGASIYFYDPDLAGDDVTSGTEVFDLYAYDFLVANRQPYPFSQAVNSANARSGWLGSSAARDAFVPFTVNASRGRIRTDFSISEVGNVNTTPPASNPQNLPGKVTSLEGPYSPINDPDTSGQFYEAKHQPINELFNKVWVDNPGIQPNVHRFIDLRVTTNGDGSEGPMHPNTGFWRASIVPGSDEVYGPDQLPGPNYGRTVRYTRTTRAPGPNQYRINYVDQAEPSDYTVLGFSSNPPTTYDPQNFMSAVIQPRFKKGYVQLNSDPDVPLPMGEILISYRFQFNGAGANSGAREDVFAVDYDTRQLIDVLLTMRNYPQSSVPNPQVVTLKSTASVRNYIR